MSPTYNLLMLFKPLERFKALKSTLSSFFIHLLRTVSIKMRWADFGNEKSRPVHYQSAVFSQPEIMSNNV